MKNLYLLTFFLFLYGTVHTQITLQAGDTPQIGDQYIIGIDSAASRYSVGSGGPSQVWDFSTISPQTTNVLNIVAPDQAQGNEFFPEATFAIDSDTVLFVQRTNDAIYYLGLAGDFLSTGETLVGKYDSPFKYLEIPTNTQTAFASAATARVQVFYPPLGDSARVTRSESIIVQTDGYGSLLMPGGTFNTLRQKRIAIVADTIEARLFGEWRPLSATRDTVVYYDWLAREAKGALLSVEVNDEGRPVNITFTVNTVPAVIAPVANFDFSPRSDAAFRFNDRSANKPDSWQWDFGDGNTSTEQNPVHTYPGPGEYLACLIAANEEGIDTICKTVTVDELPVADFDITANGDGNYNFTDQSTNNPYARRWEFGDGGVSNQRNPRHIYTTPGEYEVCLVATNTGGRDTTCQTILVVLIPDADFTVNAQSQDTYTFTDQSTDEPTDWEWDFGDGNTSTEQSPMHTYASPGTYNVCLKVSNSEGTTTSCQSVVVVFVPEAAFEIDPRGDGVYHFKDRSANTPVEWGWTFGDGSKSSEQNPQHIYMEPGDFTVCMIAGNTAGTDTVCENITVVLIPDGDFNVETQSENTYNFTDRTKNDPATWMWDFGDGNTSGEQNPEHVYDEPGEYTVCLITANSEGADTTCQALSVVFKPIAGFAYQDQGGGVFSFVDTSRYNPTSWQWDFGDDNTSTEQNPQHTFTQDGAYNVCLVAQNSAGFRVACQNVAVVITDIEDLSAELGLKVFPNPAADHFNVTMDFYQGPPLRLSVSNVLGEVIYRSDIQTRLVAPTSTWPQGTYFFRLQTQEGNTIASGPIVVGRR